MKEEDFIAPNDRLHDDYVTSRPMKEWHNIDSYVTKLLENNPGLFEYDCFAVCCRSLSLLSKQVSDWPNSVSKYASTLLSKWKGPEKQHWLELAKKAIQLTEEIDELAPRKHQRGQEPQTPKNKEGEPLNGMALRKTKKICYTEFSSPGSSDLEDVESTPCLTTHSVTLLSPILLAFCKAFPDVKYMWVEKDVRSIKEANVMFMGNIGERKADLLILRLSDARELLNVEVSGPPYRSTKKHTVGD
ncbi:878_t:CDS:2, partial [Paraglomus brasilianum]